jgi:hypothetical protein
MESRITQGTKLACLFSWDCNTVRKLGINDELLTFIKGRKDVKKVRGHLTKLAPYLGYVQIAGRHNLAPFETQVISAYWLGNNLLDKFFSEKVIANQINFPYHNLHVLAQFRPTHLNTDLVNKLLGEITDCTIQAAKVIKIKPATYLVDYYPFCWTKGKGFYFGKSQLRLVKKGLLRKNFLGQAKRGEMIVFHFGSARLIISQRKEKQLKKYTNLSFDSLNAKQG